MPDLAYQTLGVVIALGGAALLYWSLFHDRARGRRRCPKCWYDLRAATTLTCPECGRTANREGQLFKTRRRWRWAMVGVMLAAAGLVVPVVPKARRDAWPSVMPNTALIVMVPWFEDTTVITELENRELRKWQARWLAIQFERDVRRHPDHFEIAFALCQNQNLPLAAARVAFVASEADDTDIVQTALYQLMQPNMRRHLVAAVGESRLFEHLTRLCAHTDFSVRLAAVAMLIPDQFTAEVLLPFERTSALLLSALRDDEELVRMCACAGFRGMTTTPPAVRDRLAELIVSDDSVSSEALNVLRWGGVASSELIPLAAIALQSRWQQTKEEALRVFQHIGEEALPALRTALAESEDPLLERLGPVVIESIEMMEAEDHR